MRIPVMMEDAEEYTGGSRIGDLSLCDAKMPSVLRQMQNPSEEFTPHTNDPQRSVGLSFIVVLKRTVDDRAVDENAIFATRYPNVFDAASKSMP